MASIRLTSEQDQQLQEARKRAIDSTNVLNESSQDIREGKIDIFDQIARYSGGTASVMFTFLGVLIGLKNGQEYINGSFIFAMMLFVVCIAISLFLRQATRLYGYYQTNQLRLDSLRDMRIIEKDVLCNHSSETNTRKDISNVHAELEKATNRIAAKIARNQKKARLWSAIFKHGPWLLYIAFVGAYAFLFCFVVRISNYL
ncbi:hypothetical protein FBF25_04190 [Candidatus Saccharibacteria bacterium oral taxon 488]|jgi:hypothetical protein cdivTM_07069|nr:hypothetical protein FBF25_04190 [Candidatus Saccharibacteria bacterium oral taxon 488]QLF52226.1 hypothetical protein HW277_04240 [Candidatus Saccharibacteria bacterium oral taxon 488]